MLADFDCVACAPNALWSGRQPVSAPTVRAFALILAGGRGTRLKQLTERRTKPAMFFGGRFRIIDFTLANCVNSGIRRIGVVTQYNTHSLLRHVRGSLDFLNADRDATVDMLPPLACLHDEPPYRGTADAIYRNLPAILSTRAEYVLVVAGDHVYQMDYSVMLRDHVDAQAACTIGCVRVPRSEASGYGVMAIDAHRNVTGFVEKPAQPAALPGDADASLVSMGVYVFDTRYLHRLLTEDAANPASSRDFGYDVIPRVVAEGRARAHPFSMSCIDRAPSSDGYWRDVGTIDAFWAANLELASGEAGLDVDSPRWPIWTRQPSLPPAQILVGRHGERSDIADTIVSDGAVIGASTIRRSLVFRGVRIDASCRLDDAVLLPDTRIGRGCRLTKVVVDRGCTLPDGLVIGEDPVLDAQRFERSEKGVVLVTRAMLERLHAA
ncbi:glucose-1-phosphate adenylyltransferase [Burkholderia cepacia]|uniref:glucose-1-phosphate adenylyltransferase n=1 Tax=Burkholderia cepacia TaxID=292 RepID=UPI0009C12725|nr:glucose-1-phosphate adenylyltransferase [Burkholderia cepacia]